MFADPQSVTVNAVAKSLPRTGSSDSSGTFKTADGLYSLSIKHSTTKQRVNHNAQLRNDVITSSVYFPDQNVPVSASASISINAPIAGLDAATIGYIANAIVAWATPTNVAKLIGEES
jgi:hypothetical protein